MNKTAKVGLVLMAAAVALLVLGLAVGVGSRGSLGASELGYLAVFASFPLGIGGLVTFIVGLATKRPAEAPRA
jgi:hypothetical protein